MMMGEMIDGHERNASHNGTHRLPTLSASQALTDARSRGPRAISTGLKQLDLQLSPKNVFRANTDAGIPLGQVTEIYGPPGTAKTALGLQLCATVVRQGGRATWIDTATPLARARLDNCLAACDDSADAGPVKQNASPVRLLEAPTLPHLLAVLLHMPESFCDSETRLIVVDTISAPFEKAYAREQYGINTSEATKWAAGRKFAVMGELVRRLGKLAVMHDLAVVLLCQCATKLRQGAPAVLLPSVAGHEWEMGISSRVVLYKDWPPLGSSEPDLDATKINSACYAAVCKTGGSQVDSDSTVVIPFEITQRGLHQLQTQTSRHIPTVLSSPVRPAKRTYVEIADSDADDLDSDDDYSWMNDDEIASADIANVVSAQAHDDAVTSHAIIHDDSQG